MMTPITLITRNLISTHTHTHTHYKCYIKNNDKELSNSEGYKMEFFKVISVSGIELTFS
jgi:hypothetical protein